MGRITQRQATLALVSLIFITLAVIVISNGLRPLSAIAGQEVYYVVSLLITAVLWLLAWVNWPYVRHLTIFLLTVITPFTIPDAFLTPVVPMRVLIPPILASVILGIPGVVGSAAVTWLLLLWRSGAESTIATPQFISIYIMAVGGLVLGRIVVDARLARERDLLQALMDNMPDLIYFKDTASRFSRINRTHMKLLGLNDPLAAMGKTDFDFQPAALSQQFFAEEQEMMKTGKPILDRIEYNPTVDGRPRWLSATKTPIKDKTGLITGMVGISRDITERMLMEQALQESERNYHEIFNASNDAIFIHDAPTGAILDVNSRMLEMYGYTYNEALEVVIGELAAGEPPYSPLEAMHWFEKALTDGPQLFEWHGRRKNGELFWVEVSLRSSEIGGHGRVLAVVRDIGERKRAEESLRLSEERFAKAFRASQDAIAISTVADGRIIEINDAHTRIFGYSHEEAIGQTTLDLHLYVNPADRQRLLAILQEKGEIHDLEIVAQRKSGEAFDCLFSAETVYLQSELCLVATMRDITAEKQAAAALQAYAAELERSNRELESFAYIASHDLQEPLRKIQSFSHRLLERYGAQLDERGQDYLQRMDNAAVRMQALIRDLLAYARISTHGGAFTAVSLANVAQEVVADLETRLEASNGRVVIGDLPVIEADPTQMRQLLQNLIGNGLKFHQPGVPPIVEVAGEVITTPDRRSVFWLTVADNGIGFDEAYLPRLFTMFQRLHGRDSYEGTGVGLAICRRIAERHGGTITARSIPGDGTTFIVTLPVKQPPG